MARNRQRADKYRDLGDVGAVGIEFVLAIGVGYYGGRWLDGRFFGGHGWVTGIGAFLGIFAAFKAIWDAAKRANKRLEELDETERKEREERTQQIEHRARRARDERNAKDEPDETDPDDGDEHDPDDRTRREKPPR